jgi:hypothetical protein
LINRLIVFDAESKEDITINEEFKKGLETQTIKTFLTKIEEADDLEQQTSLNDFISINLSIRPSLRRTNVSSDEAYEIDRD